MIRDRKCPDPFEVVRVFRMLRIADRLQELGVAPDAADIFGWAGALACHADGKTYVFCRVDDLFYRDLVCPAVTEQKCGLFCVIASGKV